MYTLPHPPSNTPLTSITPSPSHTPLTSLHTLLHLLHTLTCTTLTHTILTHTTHTHHPHTHAPHIPLHAPHTHTSLTQIRHIPHIHHPSRLTPSRLTPSHAPHTLHVQVHQYPPEASGGWRYLFQQEQEVFYQPLITRIQG